LGLKIDWQIRSNFNILETVENKNKFPLQSVLVTHLLTFISKTIHFIPSKDIGQRKIINPATFKPFSRILI